MKHLIRYSIILIAITLLDQAVCPARSRTEDLSKTVAYLLDYVARSDYTFIRNGKPHTSREAAKHMKAKYEHFRKKIKTPEDFIRLAATRSLATGRPYLVKAKDGKVIRNAAWLRKVLADYRESHNAHRMIK